MPSTLRSVVAYPTIVVMTLLLGPVAVLGTKLPRRWHISDRVAALWAALFLKLAGLSYEVSGRENLRPERPQIIVSNHISNLDPMLHWLALWPTHYRYLAKKEIYRIPIFRWFIREMHMIKVDRSAGPDGFDDLNQRVARVFGLGYSLLIYGEGTRSREGAVKEFKKGPFVIAEALSAPILPVTIHGADRAWPPGDWRMRGGHARVIIHPLEEFEGTLEGMREKVRKIISETYEILDQS